MARKVSLAPKQAVLLIQEVVQAVAPSRLAEKGLSGLLNKLMLALGAKIGEDGDLKFKVPDEGVTLELEDVEIFGAKTALVQAVAGLGDRRPRANVGYRNCSARPLAKALGIEKVFLLETAPPAGADGDDKLEMEFDDDAEESSASEGKATG